MYCCPFCFESYECITSLKTHCKVKHTKTHSIFRCRQKLSTGRTQLSSITCSRSFTDIYSFLKHLSKTHSINSNTACGNSLKNSMENNIYHRNNMEEITINSSQSNSMKEITVDSSQLMPSVSHVTNNSDTSVNISVTEFAEKIAQSSTLFVANLYSRPSLPRALCQEIIELIKNQLNCVQILQEKYKSIDPNPHQDLIAMFNILHNKFENYSSEYQTMSYFKSLHSLIEPQEICIDAFIDTSIKTSNKQLLVRNRKICIVPLEEMLKTFLELPNVYNSIVTNIQENEQNVIKNIFQSEIWRSLKQRHTNVVLPLILYYDELEINNPLGTHRGLNKLGVVYCTIGGINERFASMLENIFLVQLHKVIDYEAVGNKQIFAFLVNEINKLQTNGISLNIENSEKKVNFALLYILGDNLGIHAIFGLNTSFNSNYSCRMCLADTSTRKKQIIEDVELLRTIDNYAADVKDQSHGIKEECIFHSIKNFHITENRSVDIMHDVFEGVCRYNLGQLLFKLIFTDKLFSLDTINNRLYSFDYGDNNLNKPPLINMDALKKKYIIYSASEMAILWQHLGLIIGDLIPETNKTWKLYIIFRKILFIITSREVTNENISLLRQLISEHHALYINLFNDTLKPKLHLLLHYPGIMQRTGSLRYMSSIRFEAKHKELKQTANAITSRKNPPYTLTLKHQLLLNYRFILKKGFENRLECGIILHEKLTDIDCYKNFVSILPFASFHDYKCVSWAKIDGTLYKSNMVIEIDINNCKFGNIQYILKNDLCEIFFLYKELLVLEFNPHFYVHEITETDSWGFISYSELCTFKPNNIYFVRGKKFIPEFLS